MRALNVPEGAMSVHNLLLFLFGAAVGSLSGVLGIGGGVVLVPGLMLLFGLTQPEAQGTSLAVLVPPIGIFAAIIYYRNGYVELPLAAWLASGFVVGACVGAKAVPYLPPNVLRVSFGAILLWLGFSFTISQSPRRDRCCVAGDGGHARFVDCGLHCAAAPITVQGATGAA